MNESNQSVFPDVRTYLEVEVEVEWKRLSPNVDTLK